ncbi:MAG: histidinol dehydrogenase [Acutalibacteraceae bacterium]
MIKTVYANSITADRVIPRYKNNSDVADIVADIIKDVRENGDRALIAYAEKFDGASLTSLEVTNEEFDEAMAQVEPEFIDILTEARDNIFAFHSRQRRDNFMVNDKQGVVLGQKYLPLARVGLYVPGGTAAYPSSVLMNCVPAKIAGVPEIVMTTPPDKNGKVNPAILAAAKIAGVDKVYKSGGAQAVAALCYGTETIARVDKIVGPGNVFVAEAKRQVYGMVDIDMIAGPSEILIVADGGCRAKNVAADLLSQAEHDKNASAILITTDKALAAEVAEEIERQLDGLLRRDIARVSIDNNGMILIADSIEEAVTLSNEIAPEHLELCVESPFDYLSSVKNAGSVFLGRNTPESLGDYFAGPNHTLPTSGTARFSSPLSVDDFIKKTQFIYYTPEALGRVSDKVAAFARKEGLTAHARAAEIRFE